MKQHFSETRDQLVPFSIIRRLAALLYDSLISIALLMTTTGLYMLVSSIIMGADEYKAMNDSGQTMHDPVLSSLLFITLFIFFGYFWTKNGQTLGMQVWHLRVQNKDNSHISWNQALLRFMTAIPSLGLIGLGYLWSIFDKESRTWPCLISESEIVRIPKRK